MMMHTMLPLENKDGWSVGFYIDLDTQQKWIEICQFREEPDALNRVNILNGGPGGFALKPNDRIVAAMIGGAK